jgi:opacity protein-like surface antigen
MTSFQKLLVGSLLGAMFNSPMAQAADPYMVEDGSGLGLYVAVSGGWNYADSDNFEVPSVPISGEIFFLDGWTGAVALGGRITDHVRTELELAIRHNALDDEDLVGIGTIDLTGKVNVYTGLAKVAYDFGDGPFKPFIAAGIGLASFDAEIEAPVVGSDSNVVLAGSLGAGVNYSLSPNAELFAAAELLLLDDVTIDPVGTGDSNLSNPMFVTVAAGLRWNF